jgi:hypothetical protein
MSPADFNEFFDRVKDCLDPHLPDYYKPHAKVEFLIFATRRRCAGSYKQVASHVGVSLSSMRRAFDRVLDGMGDYCKRELNRPLHEYIHECRPCSQWRDIRFIVDATCFGLDRPGAWLVQRLYYEAKYKKHTLKLQLVCDAGGVPRAVSRIYTGAQGDIEIFRQEKTAEMFRWQKPGEGAVTSERILADAGYVNSDILVPRTTDNQVMWSPTRQRGQSELTQRQKQLKTAIALTV